MMSVRRIGIVSGVVLVIGAAAAIMLRATTSLARPGEGDASRGSFDQQITRNVHDLFEEGRQAFRFDTFGDEAFWGDTLKLHQAIEGAALGGVGAGISPKTALQLGLKVDVDALDERTVQELKHGRVNLDDPAVTLALLRRNAVVGVTGFFNPDGSLKSMGVQCALCHSTVDNSLSFGVGHRLDGWANRDLDVGRIIAAAPDLSSVAALLSTSQGTVRTVLMSWGPGKFDAEL